MNAIHRFLCRIGAHHWMIETDPETRALFQTCERCGKERGTGALADHPFLT